MPNKGINLKYNSRKILIIGIIISILMVCFDKYQVVSQSSIRNIFALGFLLIIISIIWSWNEKENENGIYKGDVILNENYLLINSIKINWENTSDFKFEINEVKGEQLYPDQTVDFRSRMLGPSFSAGVNNFIEFNYNDIVYKTYFLFENSSHKVQFKNVIRNCYFNNFISLENTYNGFKLEYEAIQKLKQQKTEYQNNK